MGYYVMHVILNQQWIDGQDELRVAIIYTLLAKMMVYSIYTLLAKMMAQPTGFHQFIKYIITTNKY